MMHQSVIWTAARACVLICLTASAAVSVGGCGGGGNGAGENILRDPMPLDGHDNAVRAIAATLLTASFAGLDGPWERPSSGTGQSGTEDCSGGGIVTYDETGRSTEFFDCDVDADANVEILFDGTIDERCGPGASSDRCVRAGADGDPLFLALSDDDEFVSASFFLQVARDMPDPETYDDVVNGAVMMWRTAPTRGSGDFEFSNLRIVQSFNEQAQTTTAQIDGSYRLSSYDNFNCTSGGVSIETLESITYDGSVIGGRLRLDNGAGDALTASFGEDGTISIVGTDGTSDSATYQEIDALCDEVSITGTSGGPSGPGSEPCTLTIAGVCVI